MSKPKKIPATDLTSFRAAYDTLQKHANQLRNQTEPNIDDLLTLVNESVEAYKVCKSRIDAVEKALQEALDDPELSDLMQGTDRQKTGDSDAATDEEASGSHRDDGPLDADDEAEDVPF